MFHVGLIAKHTTRVLLSQSTAFLVSELLVQGEQGVSARCDDYGRAVWCKFLWIVGHMSIL